MGYRVAVTIAKQYGRAKLIDCMTNVRQLLPTYNRAVTELNKAEPANKDGEVLAQWSPELIRALDH